MKLPVAGWVALAALAIAVVSGTVWILSLPGEGESPLEGSASPVAAAAAREGAPPLPALPSAPARRPGDSEVGAPPEVSGASREAGPLERAEVGLTAEQARQKGRADDLVRDFLDLRRSIDVEDIVRLAEDPYLNPGGLALAEGEALRLLEELRPFSGERWRLMETMRQSRATALQALESTGRFEVLGPGRPPSLRPERGVSRSHVKVDWSPDNRSATITVTDEASKRAFQLTRDEFATFFDSEGERRALPSRVAEKVRAFFLRSGGGREGNGK